MDDRRFCPVCGCGLESMVLGGHSRLVCSQRECRYTFWDNPIPVVGAIVTHEGDVILGRNAAWPPGRFALITGFLEPEETPDAGVVREVREELRARCEVRELVGLYPFARNNQLLIIYHVDLLDAPATSEEIVEFRRVAPGEVRPHPHGTGPALHDWLVRKGYSPEYGEPLT